MPSGPVESDPRHLYVYGTLRSGGRAPASLRGLLRARGRKVGEGVVEGRLFHAGSYPAAVPVREDDDPAGGGEDGNGQGRPEIRGVLYALEEPDEVLRALDGYEGVQPDDGGLFRRDVVQVRLDDGRAREAWIYWYNRDPAGLPVIEGGDWRQAEARGSANSRPAG
ncbi:MAG: gamma-glutamylcyclotransferase family protein [Gemmatimonadota bacterium]